MGSNLLLQIAKQGGVYLRPDLCHSINKQCIVCIQTWSNVYLVEQMLDRPCLRERFQSITALPKKLINELRQNNFTE